MCCSSILMNVSSSAVALRRSLRSSRVSVTIHPRATTITRAVCAFERYVASALLPSRMRNLLRMDMRRFLPLRKRWVVRSQTRTSPPCVMSSVFLYIHGPLGLVIGRNPTGAGHVFIERRKTGQVCHVRFRSPQHLLRDERGACDLFAYGAELLACHFQSDGRIHCQTPLLKGQGTISSPKRL